MNDKQQSELNFWSGLLVTLGKGGFSDLRLRDFEEKTKHFSIPDGKGLDLGCGPLSIFDHMDNITAIDPLMDYYEAFDLPRRNTHLKEDGENLSFKRSSFDWVACINVADHTPSPDKLFSEIKRVLKKNGTLLFQVNFDDILASPHYELWNIDTVRNYLKDFKLVTETVERNEADHQSIYSATYVKA